MKNYLKNLQEAEEILSKIEKMIVLAQISKNKRMALLILEEIEKALKKILNSILLYEYESKLIQLYKDPILNLKTFENKSAKNFSITISEINTIKEILTLSKEHKESPIEFMKKQDIIILSKNQEIYKMSIEKLSYFLTVLKSLIKKAKHRING
ncbi:MAG: hypothetical protein WC812_00545 [Candidatus Pacearchaeota archaeon]|jgi:hypothetical protein